MNNPHVASLLPPEGAVTGFGRPGAGDKSAPLGTQRGLTMVELLIGMAIGLFIVATAASLMTGNLRENRKLMIESRLMQDLRTAADMITRDLRRAGYWAAATAGVRGDGAASAPLANPYSDVTPVGAAADHTSFRFSRDATENHTVDSNEQFAFRLRNGVIELQLGVGNWQALTDATTLTVTEFSVTPTVEEISLADFCARPCEAASSTCPPRQLVRSLAVVVSGRATGDALVTRSVRSQVRLRNDPIIGACPV
jgi:prepilin peptidase dependent protein B